MTSRRAPLLRVRPLLAGGVVLVAATLLATACFSTGKPPALPGCGKDTDCKGARICVNGECVDPQPSGAPGASPAPPATAPPTASPPASAIAQGPPPEGSPMFHVVASHDGRSRYRVATKPKERARVATGGSVFSSPAIDADGTAYFGSHDRAVRAVGADGKVRWKRVTDDLVWCSPALDVARGAGGVRADGGAGSPGAARTVYVGSDDDRLYALDAKDGAVRWTFTAGPCRRSVGVGPESSRCDVDGVTVGPDGTVYFVADGIYAVRPDGSLAFRYALPVHCAGAPALGPDGTVYAGCQDGGVYALGPDGGVRWSFRAGDDVDSAPALAADGTLYVGSDDTKLYALAPGGQLRWAVKTAGPIRSSPALGPGGIIYVGSQDDGLYAVRENGTVAWTFRAADRIVSSPVVDVAGVVLFGSQDDRLYALEPDGRLRFSVLLGGDVDGTPALGPDGAIYVGSDDGALHILR